MIIVFSLRPVVCITKKAIGVRTLQMPQQNSSGSGVHLANFPRLNNHVFVDHSDLTTKALMIKHTNDQVTLHCPNKSTLSDQRSGNTAF